MTGRHRRSWRRTAVVGAATALVLAGVSTSLAVARHEQVIRAGPPGAVLATPVRTSSAPVSRDLTGGRAGSSVALAAPTIAPVAPATTAPVPSSSPYRVVGLGDSVPAGTACDCTPYVTLVGQAQAQRLGRPVSVDNLAVDGLTTDELLAQLQQGDAAAAVAQADLVIVTIGANDFDQSTVSDESCAPPGLSCYEAALSAQVTQLDAVLARVTALHAGSAVRVLVTGYWNVFLDGTVGQEQGDAYVSHSDALTLADNALIAAASSRHGDTYVDLYTPFKGTGSTDDTSLLAADGDHPNAAGHQLIAATLEAALG